MSHGVGSFTPPFLTNMGYTMAVKASGMLYLQRCERRPAQVVEQGAYTSDNLFKMFKPFSPALWVSSP